MSKRIMTMNFTVQVIVDGDDIIGDSTIEHALIKHIASEGVASSAISEQALDFGSLKRVATVSSTLFNTYFDNPKPQ